MQDTVSVVGGAAGLYSHVFVVGAGRSGTTWLQMLLAQHPEVASAPETNLFAGYLALLDRRWKMEATRRSRDDTPTGLHALITEEEFYKSTARPLLDRVTDRILARKPGASLVLWKTPHDVHHVPLILKLLPEARFIHIIRDPRAVVASLNAAGRGWGRNWAPRGTAAGATMWQRNVSAGLEIPTLTERYLEVRYEALLADPVTELLQTFRWIGLDADPATCEGYVEACRIDRLRSGKGSSATLAPSKQTAQFFRSGKADTWQKELGATRTGVIEHIAGELMERLGYTKVHQRANFYARFLLWARRLVSGLHWRIGNVLDSAMKRL